MTNTLRNYVGQEHLKGKLDYLIKYAKKTGQHFPHTILTGAAGLGKSRLCQTIAAELGRPLVEAYGKNLEKERDIVALFWRDGKLIEPNTIIFIDEIHSVNPKQSEWLYGAAQDFRVVTNSGPIAIPKFTLIAGTTNPGKVPKPLYDRFLVQESLIFYSEDEIMTIINGIAPMESTEEAGMCSLKQWLHRITAGVPRKAVNLANMFKIYVSAHDCTPNVKAWECFLSAEGYSRAGIKVKEMTYLMCLNDFSEGASAERMAACLRTSTDDVIYNIEPQLLALGYIAKGGGGRMLTEKGSMIVCGTGGL